MNGEKVFRFLKNIFEKIKKKTRFGKSNRLFSKVLSLIFVVSILLFKGSSTTPFSGKPRVTPAPSCDAPSADVFIQKQLVQTLDNILCVIKSYPVKLDNVGIVESDVIAFKYHLSNFIDNQFGIKSDKLINDMVKGCENLYRFLADKKNHLNLKQYRSLNNLSEQDLFYIKKINNVLINRFRKYRMYNISPYLSDESPELTIISATFYCFASDNNLINLDEFINSIFARSNNSDFLKEALLKDIKNILNINKSPVNTVDKTKDKIAETWQPKPYMEKSIKEKIVKAAVIADEGVSAEDIIEYFDTAAENKKIKIQRTSINGNTIYRATKIRTDEYPNLEFTAELTIIPANDLTKNKKLNSRRRTLPDDSHYDVITFIIDKSKYADKNSSELNKHLSKVTRKLKSFSPRIPIIFVQNNSDHLIYEKICNEVSRLETLSKPIHSA